ncbi:Cof-type HAD-IIB family hydrolase [Clostridium manihotivorum]|uniref:Cof-type HAD-IIB family hydrolase n=1 Tax=Clostridium manihotivorum TaxID=2320868 RepID=A0A3R5QXK4_9CLOT|nr:Cof-type HAD-IIB family hydrolase [Clostridium manihotivorum]QAA34595.1 Cof-type HAD-IIB family hydrolase [Clostridium manihotivorum]
MSYKLVCIDMDGTLLNNKKKISSYNKEMLQKAHDKGVHIVITTGRIFNNALHYSNLLGVKSPVIATNGAIIREKDKGVVIYKNALSTETCLRLLELSQKSGVKMHFYTTDRIFASSRLHGVALKLFMSLPLPKDLRLKIRYVGKKEEWEEVFNHHKDEFVKCIVFSPSRSTLKNFRKELAAFDDISITSSGSNNVEILNKDVSKGKAVEVLANYYGISRDEIMCIGDNENDIPMIKYAGLGVAVSNGIKELKDVADYITDTNDRDGVGKAIEKFIISK